MNDKFYLEAEYETLIHNSSISLEELTNFSKFTKEILAHGNKFYHGLKSTLNSYLEESNVIEPKTQLGQLLHFIYQSSALFLNKTKQILDTFGKEIIDPLDQYKVQLKSFYEDSLVKIDKLFKVIKEADRKVEKMKQKYYDSCRFELKFEREMNKDKEKDKEVQIQQQQSTASNEHNDTLLKLKSQRENNCQLYKYEIANANRCYEEYNKDYASLIQTIKMTDETRLHYFKEHIDTFLKSFNEHNTYSMGLIKQMSTQFSSWNIETDLDKLINDLQFYSKDNGIRIPIETFESFNKKKIIPDDTLTTLASASSSISLSSESQESNQFKSLFAKGKEFISSFGDYEFIDVNYYNHDYKTKLVNNFISMLLTENEVQSDMMTQLMSLLSENQFPQFFINIYKEKQKSSFLKITNNKNLTHLANLFNTIFLNDSIDKDVLNGLILYILFISQRTYSTFGKRHKVFLCGILGRNKIFQTKKFWLDLIQFKLLTNLLQCKNKLEDMYQQLLKQQNDQNASNTFFGRVGKSFYSIANNTLSGSIMEMKIKGSINPFAQVGQFPTFYNLPQKSKEEFLTKANGELLKLIYNFIPYYANYCFGTGNAIDFIVELGNKYSISNEVINYYVICLNSASYSIKQKNLEDIRGASTDENTNVNSFNKIMMNSSSVSIKYNGIIKAKDEDKIILLKITLKYLKLKDLLSLMLLSKRSSRILSKKIYKECLNRKSLSMKSRLKIWGVLLKTSEIKQKYSYKEVSIVANEVEYNKNSNSPLSIIDCDVKRTLFDTNQVESRETITRILKTVAYLLHDITYCQGLNFIIKFLYLITQNEEEAFYLMMGLLINSSFSTIFLNDLEQLKDNFTLFDKLLGLYLPVIQYYFNSNNIMPNYYLASWFITLFTFSIMKDNQLKALVKIWDNFILFGWKTILYTGLIVLENQEEKVIKMKTDSLLEYLIEGIIQNDFYYEYELFINKISKCSLSNQLILNLENEVNQEKNISFGKKKH